MPMAGEYYLYFLKLRKGYFYVGISKYPESRIKAHFDGIGCQVTKKYRPWKILGVWRLGNMTYPEAEKIETAFTLEMMLKNGNKVRGGLYHNLKEDVPAILRCNMVQKNILAGYDKVYVKAPKKKLKEKKQEGGQKDKLPPYRSMTFDEAVACLYDYWQSNGQMYKSLDDAERKILKKGWYMK